MPVLAFLFIIGARLLPAQTTATLPVRPDSLKFAVIGDSGTGDGPQFDVGVRMTEARSSFPFELVIMLGDNLYGRQQPQDFVTKFERPYASLLSAGVLFYASLGNHDNQVDRTYPRFNMDGQRYYTYARKNVRFFALDSNQMDPRQLAWLENTLKQSADAWKICYFHHPLYSDGRRHGSDGYCHGSESGRDYNHRLHRHRARQQLRTTGTVSRKSRGLWASRSAGESFSCENRAHTFEPQCGYPTAGIECATAIGDERGGIELARKGTNARYLIFQR